jgi:hypothetical protein
MSKNTGTIYRSFHVEEPMSLDELAYEIQKCIKRGDPYYLSALIHKNLELSRKLPRSLFFDNYSQEKNKGDNALHIAIRGYEDTLVNFLFLCEHAKLLQSLINDEHDTPLDLAIKMGKLNYVKQMLAWIKIEPKYCGPVKGVLKNCLKLSLTSEKHDITDYLIEKFKAFAALKESPALNGNEYGISDDAFLQSFKEPNKEILLQKLKKDFKFSGGKVYKDLSKFRDIPKATKPIILKEVQYCGDDCVGVKEKDQKNNKEGVLQKDSAKEKMDSKIVPEEFLKKIDYLEAGQGDIDRCILGSGANDDDDCSSS